MPDQLSDRSKVADLVDAVRVWLWFDNEVEPPAPNAPYENHVEYERRKLAITEAVAGAVHDCSPALDETLASGEEGTE